MRLNIAVLRSKPATIVVIVVVIVAGVSLRLMAATKGSNYDFESFQIVTRIMSTGGNVYAETSRYNYGPVWFHALDMLDRIVSINPASREIWFRYIVSMFLTLVDVLIFVVLLHAKGPRTASLFFLNPISIIITGYHNQFDNLAILLGMFAVLSIGDVHRRLTGRTWIGLLLLGVSLMTKHVLFAFPLWLAVKQRRLSVKLCAMVVPAAVFFVAFIPYWSDGSRGIVDNVFLYGSRNNEVFFRLFIPGAVSQFVDARSVWILVLVVFGFICRRRSSLDSLLLYSALLVATSPGMANQYLAIPIAFVSANPNVFTGLYTVLGAWHLLVDPDGLHIEGLLAWNPLGTNEAYAWLVSLLTAGCIWVIWRRDLGRLGALVRSEINFQLGLREEG